MSVHPRRMRFEAQRGGAARRRSREVRLTSFGRAGHASRAARRVRRGREAPFPLFRALPARARGALSRRARTASRASTLLPQRRAARLRARRRVSMFCPRQSDHTQRTSRCTQTAMLRRWAPRSRRRFAIVLLVREGEERRRKQNENESTKQKTEPNTIALCNTFNSLK